MSIRAACLAFRISQACYRDEAKHQAENDEIADWLLRLTDNNRNWGFGLCFLYQPTVCGPDQARAHAGLKTDTRQLVDPLRQVMRLTCHLAQRHKEVKMSFSKN